MNDRKINDLRTAIRQDMQDLINFKTIVVDSEMAFFETYLNHKIRQNIFEVFRLEMDRIKANAPKE